MPNYKTHKVITLSLSVALLSVPAVSLDWRHLALSGGCVLGLLIHPDWDLNKNAMGWVGRALFVDEYEALVPHRHKISHTPLFGTLVRFLLTFTLPVLAVGLIFKWWVPWELALMVFGGLCLADIGHCVSDWIVTKTKTRVRRKKR